MTLIWTTIGAILTLSIYSFLYKDNPFYKFAEHLVVGVSAGYYLVIYYFNFIHPNVFSPVFLLRLGGEPIGFGSFLWWMALIPGVLGILLYARFFPKISWVGRYALGIYVGGYAGLGISPVMQARVLEQVGRPWVRSPARRTPSPPFRWATDSRRSHRNGPNQGHRRAD